MQTKDRTTLTCAILLRRWSGLAIIDASCLLKARLLPGSNQLQTYRQKTEAYVSVTLPNFVADLLRMQSSEHPDYFFWDKNRRNRRSQVHWFETRLKKIYDKAGIYPRGAHRFRDTMAVEYLDNGGDMEKLARFLGHSTSATTRLHYNPWDRSRQKVLDDDMKRSHIAQGIIEPTKETECSKSRLGPDLTAAPGPAKLFPFKLKNATAPRTGRAWVVDPNAESRSRAVHCRQRRNSAPPRPNVVIPRRSSKKALDFFRGDWRTIKTHT